MQVGGELYRTVWDEDGQVRIIDQTRLPHSFEIISISSVEEMVHAIKVMQVRGAPAIGIAAAYGVYLASIDAKAKSNFQHAIRVASEKLIATRPTAINLAWALEQQLKIVEHASSESVQAELLSGARQLAEKDVSACRQIGLQGVRLLEELSAKVKGRPIQIMTHCNAGWLACVDFGTATAPIYEAHARGIPLHVWVSETRPRNQGLQLTAWELGQAGIPHTIIVDNAAGFLMQQGKVDIVIVGSDRTTFTGDVANKIGTYLKALAARAHGIPFYVALPSSTIDWKIRNGVREIPVEERAAEEILYVEGVAEGEPCRVRIAPQAAAALNPAFDVTPRELVTGLISERGICAATEAGIRGLFSE